MLILGLPLPPLRLAIRDRVPQHRHPRVRGAGSRVLESLDELEPIEQFLEIVRAL